MAEPSQLLYFLVGGFLRRAQPGMLTGSRYIGVVNVLNLLAKVNFLDYCASHCYVLAPWSGSIAD